METILGFEEAVFGSEIGRPRRLSTIIWHQCLDERHLTEAWHGKARHCTAWRGTARHGATRHGAARHGTAGRGTSFTRPERGATTRQDTFLSVVL